MLTTSWLTLLNPNANEFIPGQKTHSLGLSSAASDRSSSSTTSQGSADAQMRHMYLELILGRPQQNAPHLHKEQKSKAKHKKRK